MFLLNLRKQKRTYTKRFGDLLKAACPSMPASFIDRANCIGPEYKSYTNKKKCCSIVVHFTSYIYRTLFYRKKKKKKDVRTKSDLTKRRYGIFNDAIDLNFSLTLIT